MKTFHFLTARNSFRNAMSSRFTEFSWFHEILFTGTIHNHSAEQEFFHEMLFLEIYDAYITRPQSTIKKIPAK